MADDVRKGKSIRCVAGAHGVLPNQVYAACHEFSVAWQNRRAKVSKFAVLAALKTGQHIKAIAADAGLSRQRVLQIRDEAKEHGLL